MAGADCVDLQVIHDLYLNWSSFCVHAILDSQGYFYIIWIQIGLADDPEHTDGDLQNSHKL